MTFASDLEVTWISEFESNIIYTRRTANKLPLARLLQKHSKTVVLLRKPLKFFECFRTRWWMPHTPPYGCPFPNKDEISHPCPLILALDVAMLEAKAMTFRTPGESEDKKDLVMVDGLVCFVDRWNVAMPASWALAPIDIRTTWLSDSSHDSNATWITSAFFAFPTGTPTKVRRRTRPTSLAPSNFSQANWSFEVLVVRPERW